MPNYERIYVIGGNDVKNFLKECEYYDIETDKWLSIAEMNIARDSAACCSFNDKLIYVFSGRTKFKPKEITDVCEVYDIKNNTWQVLNIINKNIWTAFDLAMSH